MYVSYADILGHRVPLSVNEAVGLALAAIEAIEAAAREPACGSGASTLSLADGILLHQGGRVTVTAAHDTLTSADPVVSLCSFLHDALMRQGASDRPPVPGPLLLLLARAARTIDLPAPTIDEFVTALKRFGSGDVMALASVYRRCLRASTLAGSGTAGNADDSAAVVLADDGSNATKWRGPDRRRAGPTTAELRQYLRETECELFQALQRSRRSPWRAAGATAAGLLLAVAGVLVMMLSEGTAVPISSGPPAIANTEAHAPEASGPTEAVATPSATATAVSSRHSSTVGSEPSPLLTAAAVGADVFSPSYARADGVLLFHAGRAPSALMRASFGSSDEPTVATLVQDGSANFHGTLSPDGQWLAYDSDREGTRAVYVARADGSQPQQVSGDGYAAVPRWSPDGRLLAFVRAEAGQRGVWNVWVLDLAARGLSRVSGHVVGQAWGASWFPDGERVAYSVEDRLVIVSLKDGARRVLRSPLPGRLVRTPAVSPDGRAIVFQVYRDGVWLADVRTGAMRKLLTDHAAEEFAWTPDGERVVYHTRRRGAWSLWQLPVTAAGAGRG